MAVICQLGYPGGLNVNQPAATNSERFKTNILLTQSRPVAERRSLNVLHFFGDGHPMEQTAVTFIAARGSMNQTAVIPHHQHIG